MEILPNSDIYEQAVVKTVAGFFHGISKHLFGVTRSRGATRLIRAGSIQNDEVVMPQSPTAESDLMIPLIVTHSSCLPMSPDSVYRYFIFSIVIFCPAASSPETGAWAGKRSSS